tara:strand:- start:12695 stop:13594 length:900 start_codon:yes stop_codon:yes gene_type:complete
MASSIVNASEFKATSTAYTKPKANQSGGKSVGIIYNKKAIRLQIPTLLTWGVNVYENDGKDNSYDFSLQFPREDYQTDETNKAVESLISFEDKIKADAIVNCKEWFGKNISSAEVIDALWTPMLRYPKNAETGEPDKTRAPTLRIKMPVWEGDYKFELYSPTGTQLFPDEEGGGDFESILTKGSYTSALIQCGGIWFANGKFGVTWKLVQAVVKPKESLKGKCHIVLSAEDKKILEADNAVESDDENNVNDSDGEDVVANEVAAEIEAAEDENSLEPEPEPEPAKPPPKKKRAVKKAAV